MNKSTTSTAKAIKPRAGTSRRTKAEREQFAREEQAKEKVVTQQSPGLNTSNVKAARGRGAAILERTRSDATSGVFGTGTGEKQKRKTGVDTGYEELLEGREEGAVDAVKKTQTTKKKNVRKTVVTEDGNVEGTADPANPTAAVEDDLSSDDEPDQPRRDIERIWLSSDEEDTSIAKQKGKQRATSHERRIPGGLRPVRAPRSKMAEVDDTEPTKKGRPVRKSGSDPVDVDEMEVDDPELVKDIRPSPEVKKRQPRRLTGKSKDIRFATETVEERAERLQASDDISKLRHIFTSHSSKTDSNLDLEKNDRRLFLVQFPPITPALTDPSASTDDVMEIKQENPPTTSIPTTGSRVDGKTIKLEPNAASTQSKDVLTVNSVSELPSGFVGKLNVRASGKVTMDWGGTDMEVRMGTEVDFLQDAILIEPPTAPLKSENDDHEGNGGHGLHEADVTGKVYALGQISSKLVVVPDWGKLYD